MKYRNLDHSSSDTPRAELSLSGPVLTNLLQAVLEKGVRFRFKVKGFSMSPFIKNGDMVTLSLLEHSPDIGDIVAFIRQNSGRLVVHRLVEKRSDNYLIKGDNTPGVDRHVRKSDIRGCVKRVERNGKKILLGLGPEKYVIALLSRTGILPNLLAQIRRLTQPIFRNNRKKYN